jgi:hypothetical protein
MNTESKFIALCREVEMLKIDFVLFPLEGFPVIFSNPKPVDDDAKRFLIKSVRNIASFRDLDSERAQLKDSPTQFPMERVSDNNSILYNLDDQKSK